MHKMSKESASTIASLMNRIDKLEAKMDKETALLESKIDELGSEASRYSYAFDLLMNHFDKLPDSIQKKLDKQLKELGLWMKDMKDIY